jgi:hypothetical protein
VHTQASDVAGWDEAAAQYTFYACSAWLRFVDSDLNAQPGYARNGDTLLIAHANPGETHADYSAGKVLQADVGERLILGGRRGYLSGLCGDVERLRSLIEQAMAHAQLDVGAWWWPYLPTSDVVSMLDAGLVSPNDVHLLTLDCIIDIVGSDINEFIDSLPEKQRRTNARRERRKFDESGLKLRILRLSEMYESGAPLLGQIQQKYGNELTPQYLEYLTNFLRRQATHLDDQAVVFGAYSADDLVGFSVGYVFGDEMTIRIAGLDYPNLRAANEYAQLTVHAPLEYCLAHGLRRLHLGTESYEAKCRRGAQARALWAVAPGVVQRAAAREETQARLSAALPQYEASALREELLRILDR